VDKDIKRHPGIALLKQEMPTMGFINIKESEIQRSYKVRRRGAYDKIIA